MRKFEKVSFGQYAKDILDVKETPEAATAHIRTDKMQTVIYCFVLLFNFLDIFAITLLLNNFICIYLKSRTNAPLPFEQTGQAIY
jgi:hypothetical protein